MTYKIKDLNNAEIIGSFQNEELQKTAFEEKLKEINYYCNKND